MFHSIIQFRQRLKDGQILLGAGINLTDPLASEALADSVDFLWYDFEHQAMSMDVLRQHLMVARLKKTPGIVRVPRPGTELLDTILDAGASGIVVPRVRSADEVRQVVAACRYPPTGRRGFWPLIPTNYSRDDIDEYLKQANENLFVSVMIETAEAVEAIDDVVAIEGLDSVVLGLMDLSGSYNVLGQADHPQVVASMEKVIASAQAAGMPVGTGQGTDVERISDLARRGIQWFQTGLDSLYMVEFMDQHTSRLRDRIQRDAGPA